MNFENGTFLTLQINHLYGLSPICQVVYFWLCKHANNETNKCWPSIELLSKECGSSRSPVIKALNILEKLGKIKKEKGKRNSNQYEIIINPAVSNQDVSNQDVSNQDVSNQDVSNQDVSNQDVSNQDHSSLKSRLSVVSNQDTNYNHITKTNSKCRRIGNRSSPFCATFQP